ncbi:MAG TPA: hypothetical protein VH763_12670 [Gemmatimonadales bacterium]|jgi:hypothetical protein
MVRKTREQVWRELDQLGEDEVRARLVAHPGTVEEPGLIQEWLAQRERVASALAETTSQMGKRARRGLGPVKLIGGLALLTVAGVALGFLLAKRKR